MDNKVVNVGHLKLIIFIIVALSPINFHLGAKYP